MLGSFAKSRARHRHYDAGPELGQLPGLEHVPVDRLGRGVIDELLDRDQSGSLRIMLSVHGLSSLQNGCSGSAVASTVLDKAP